MTQEQLQEVVRKQEQLKADGRNILALGSLSIMTIALVGAFTAQSESLMMNNVLLAAFGALIGGFTLTTNPKKK